MLDESSFFTFFAAFLEARGRAEVVDDDDDEVFECVSLASLLEDAPPLRGVSLQSPLSK